MPAALEAKPINILLIEDDEVDVMNVQRAFNHNQIPRSSLYHAANGLEALERLRLPANDQPSLIPKDRLLILLDLNMPRMSGIEFLQELRLDKSLQSTPVIVLTTSDEERDRIDAYRLNVAGYILKPVAFHKFIQTISCLNEYWAMCEMPPSPLEP